MLCCNLMQWKEQHFSHTTSSKVTFCSPGFSPFSSSSSSSAPPSPTCPSSSSSSIASSSTSSSSSSSPSLFHTLIPTRSSSSA